MMRNQGPHIYIFILLSCIVINLIGISWIFPKHSGNGNNYKSDATEHEGLNTVAPHFVAHETLTTVNSILDKIDESSKTFKAETIGSSSPLRRGEPARQDKKSNQTTTTLKQQQQRQRWFNAGTGTTNSSTALPPWVNLAVANLAVANLAASNGTSKTSPITNNNNNQNKSSIVFTKTKKRSKKMMQTRARQKPLSTTSSSSLDKLNHQLYHKFDANNAPLMIKPGGTIDIPSPPYHNNSSFSKIQVRVLLFEHFNNRTIYFRDDGPARNISDEVLNICIDGMEQSPYFNVLPPKFIPNDPSFYIHEESSQDLFIVTSDDDDQNKTATPTHPSPLIWMIDMRRTFRLSQVVSLVSQTLKHHRKNLEQKLPPNTVITPNLKLVFVDYKDKPHMTLCSDIIGLEELWNMLGGKHNVRQIKQMIVSGRMWVEENQFTFPGMVLDPALVNSCFDNDQYPTLYAPYTVRSDFVEEIQTMHKDFLPPKASKHDPTLILSPPHTMRSTDVAHFWGIREKDDTAHLRNAVTEKLQKIQKRNSGLNIIADHVSVAERTGRTSVHQAYLEGLVTSKIVVVAQRDKWEDHYRLFEAIIGGALVMTDPMLTLPPGYINGTNIIVYGSLDELQDMIMYYLKNDNQRIEIATKGWQLAMESHRTFHWMERLFFGQALTNITSTTDDSI